ncbi:MAG: hypothetical protein WBI74_03580 [Caldicoprobacterales bacterium]|jgi:hypothetical protein
MRKTSKGRGYKRKKLNKNNYLYGNYIYVTDHAVTRYQQRIKKVSHENAENAIIESVKRSRLIALTKYGGREIRENRGVIYVCELQGNCLNVITVLLGNVDLRFVV